ncbi:LigA protein [Kutzneria sp. 744]|nr:LigA protein [Kutzneria sp. 744]
MDCMTCREALSARMDGEQEPVPAASTDLHLEECAACQAWSAEASRLTRTLRVRPVGAVPDLAARILEDAPASIPRVHWSRIALGLVALVQIALGVAEVFGADQVMPGMVMGGHLFNESTAWNLALGVGLLWAAMRPRAVVGMLPVLTGFLVALAAFSAHDLIDGQVGLSRVVSHGLLVVGLALLWVIRRQDSGFGEPSRVRQADDDRAVDGVTTSRAPAERGRRGGGPLRPTGRHNAA